MATDDYGRLIIDPSAEETIYAWALVEFTEINPDLIFLDQHHAQMWAALHFELGRPIIPVTVNGRDIRAT